MAKARFDLTESHTTDVRGVGTIIPVVNADGTRGTAVYARNVTEATTAVGDSAIMGVEVAVELVAPVATAMTTLMVSGEIVIAMGIIANDSYGWYQKDGYCYAVKMDGTADITNGVALKGVNADVHLVTKGAAVAAAPGDWIALQAYADAAVVVKKAYKAP